MDNISRFYRDMYLHAKELARLGKKDESLDICWDLRLQPNLSLYRRAHVNLLIASIVEVRAHPLAAKYAQEAIELIAEVKAQGFATNFAHLDYLHEESVKVKDRIELQLREMQEEVSAPGQMQPTLDLSVLGKQAVKQLRQDHGESALGEMTLQERQPLFIEGMYTDTYMSVATIRENMTASNDTGPIPGGTKSPAFSPVGSNIGSTTARHKGAFLSPGDVGQIQGGVAGLKLDEGYYSKDTTPADQLPRRGERSGDST